MTTTINEITENYRFLKKAISAEGFIELYFSKLPLHRTGVECFNAINDQYFDITGEYRYSSFNSFSNQLTRSYKK